MDRANRLPPRRELVDDAHIEIPVHGHAQRPRNGGGGHHQDVRRNLCLGPQTGALGHSEPVLLVDHDQAEAMEDHLGLEHRMGADKEMDRAVREASEDGLPIRGLDGSRQQFHADGQVAEHLPKAGEVLLGQDFRGGHDAGLTPVVHGEQGGQQGHHRLSAAHVALQQAVHVGAVARVLPDFADDPLLGAGELKGNPLGVEAVELLADLSEGRAGQGRGLSVAVLDEQQLQEQELLEFQTEPAQPFGLHVGRLMDLFHGHGETGQPAVGQDAVRQGLGHPFGPMQLPELGDEALNGLADAVGIQPEPTEAFGGAIHRMEGAGRPGLLQGQHLGVGHVASALVVTDAAPQHARLADGQVAGHPFGALEPDQGQDVSVLVDEFGFEPLTPLLLDLLELADGAPQLDLHGTRHSLRHPVETGAVLVSERQVEQQVTTGSDGEVLRQRLCPFGPDSLQEFDRGGGVQRFRHRGRKIRPTCEPGARGGI